MRLKPRRVVENILIRLLKDERLVVLLGARQVGKTSIMHLLVTGNLKHYPAKKRQGMWVVSPTEFLEIYRILK